MPDSDNFINAGTVEEITSRGCVVIRGKDHPIAVFFDNGKIKAVDNRCPHMGFPLSKGGVHEGILTCYWHHARFDLASGCAFDLWADDVPTAPVQIRDGKVFVSPVCHFADGAEHWRRRLAEGMGQNISLIIAKSVIAQLRAGGDYRQIVRDGALFGVRHRDGWASGMTILTALANLAPQLPEEEQYLALYHGLSRVADDCEGEVPRRDRQPLEGSDVDLATLKQWLRDWTKVRHRDGAERTALTAIARGCTQAELADLLLSAVTDRAYADTGHPLDFINKSFDLLDVIGWEQAETILPTLVRQLVMARGGEESSAWRHPIDLIGLCNEAFTQLPQWFEAGHGKKWNDEAAVAEGFLEGEPDQLIALLREAFRDGARPTQLTRALCYAAAMRIARFGTSNEFGDWITALHTFTYCNALHQGLKRIEQSDGTLVSLDPIRGIFHGAMSVYLDRFLNIPPAHLPDKLDDESADAKALLARFLATLDTQQRVTAAGKVVARYLSLGHPIDPLLVTLARGVLREDANFHTFQMLEAAIQQYHEWPAGSEEARHILIALARYSAAHAPTQRSQLQTAEIALKLHRGTALHEDEGEDNAR
jgi:nitrite reductase/ring-hydroxylating ferredoxin subunit